MAYWTILCQSTAQDESKNYFGITLDTNAATWTVSGPDANKVFLTKHGQFNIVIAPERGTRLANHDNKEVAFMTGLDGTTAAKKSGHGRASESGKTFDWTLDSK